MPGYLPYLLDNLFHLYIISGVLFQLLETLSLLMAGRIVRDVLVLREMFPQEEGLDSCSLECLESGCKQLDLV